MSIRSGQIFRRGIHVSRKIQFRAKKLEVTPETPYNGKNKFLWGTPKKSAGAIGNFKRTSGNSREKQNATTIPITSPGGSPYLEENLTFGSVCQYPSTAARTLGRLGSFSREEQNELFKEHCTLLRDSSSKSMHEIVENSANEPSRNTRICIVGEPGVGKSTALAHAHAFAAAKGYVILHLPRTENLINGTSDALYSQKHGLYIQAMLARRWMNKIYRSNEEVLKTIKPSERVMTSSGTYQPHSPNAMKSLFNFLKEGKKRKDAFNVLDDFMVEIAEQDQAPVLFSMDDINILTSKVWSENRTTDNKKVKILDLQLIKHFFDFYSGEKTFKRGFMLASTTGKDAITSTLRVGLGLEEAPYYAKEKVYDHDLASKFKGIEQFEIPRLSEDEANALLNYYNEAKFIYQELTKSLRSELYFLSGNGNPRSLLRSCSHPVPELGKM